MVIQDSSCKVADGDLWMEVRELGKGRNGHGSVKCQISREGCAVRINVKGVITDIRFVEGEAHIVKNPSPEDIGKKPISVRVRDAGYVRDFKNHKRCWINPLRRSIIIKSDKGMKSTTIAFSNEGEVILLREQNPRQK